MAHNTAKLVETLLETHIKGEDQIDLTKKTDRQLRAMLHNNAPNSTTALSRPEEARTRHRAAWAEISRRRSVAESLLEGEALDELGGQVQVTFQDQDLGVYTTTGDMQNGIAQIIADDLYDTALENGHVDGEDFDYEGDFRDGAIEQSLLAIDAFNHNTEPSDASVVNVEVNGGVECYNGTWTFRFL